MEGILLQLSAKVFKLKIMKKSKSTYWTVLFSLIAIPTILCYTVNRGNVNLVGIVAGLCYFGAIAMLFINPKNLK